MFHIYTTNDDTRITTKKTSPVHKIQQFEMCITIILNRYLIIKSNNDIITMIINFLLRIQLNWK